MQTIRTNELASATGGAFAPRFGYYPYAGYGYYPYAPAYRPAYHRPEYRPEYRPAAYPAYWAPQYAAPAFYW